MYPIRKPPIAIVLHHAASANPTSLNQEKGIWNGIKQSAISKHGRPDYHFGIGASGNRYIGAPLDTWVVHCGIDEWEDYYGVNNQNSIAICAIGNFENVQMTEKQIQGIVDCIRYIKNIYPEVFLKLHREIVATVCPGEYYPYLDIYRRVKGMGVTIVLKPQSEDKWYAVVNGVKTPITVKAIINGKNVELPACPVEINDSYYLPLRFITEKLGCKVTWDGTKKEITITKE